MVHATFDLPETTLARLEATAAERGSSCSDIVQVALEAWLQRRRLSPAEWQDAWRTLQAELAADMPEGVSSEEIEAEIAAAIDEVWADERAARSR